jgi:hypothetical protein
MKTWKEFMEQIEKEAVTRGTGAQMRLERLKHKFRYEAQMAVRAIYPEDKTRLPPE